MWEIALTSEPEWPREAFDEAEPELTVYGNLVPATQGVTETEIVLGHGDNRSIFQTFALPKTPKTPLTYLLDPAATPPGVPELEIRVADRLWQRVASFFDQPAEAQIYVVRRDDDGTDVIQFGDGINGARLPTGRNTVVATYRVGSAARGPLADDTEAKAKGKLKPITAVHLPRDVTGGADPETAANARDAAPLGLQSLGRLVGLSDYEAEALALPGVLKAGAVFLPRDNAPIIELTVLTESETEEASAAVTEAMRTANRCRGPARYPLIVTPGARAWVQVRLRLGYDPTFRVADLEAAVAAALGTMEPEAEAPTDGLFALANRKFRPGRARQPGNRRGPAGRGNLVGHGARLPPARHQPDRRSG